MAYASYARGYKAGGFNLDRERTRQPDVNPAHAPAASPRYRIRSFDKELVDSYELGVKTQWARQQPAAERRGVLPGLHGLPAQHVHRPAVRRDLAAAGRLAGRRPRHRVVHAARAAEPARRRDLRRDGRSRTSARPTAFFRPEREDDPLSFAPEWSASLSATFEQPIGASLLFRANIGAKYTSEYNTGSNLDPRKIQDALHAGECTHRLRRRGRAAG